MGVTIAQKFAGEGKDVTLVTPAAKLASYMDYTLEGPMLHRELRRLGVKILQETMVESIAPGFCEVFNVWQPEKRSSIEIDSIVLCTQRAKQDELYHQLRAATDRLEAEGIEHLLLIGDASAPRMIVDCVFDGHRVGREIDSEDPAVPLPFIRERRIWGSSTNDDYLRELHLSSDSQLSEVPASEGVPASKHHNLSALLLGQLDSRTDRATNQPHRNSLTIQAD